MIRYAFAALAVVAAAATVQIVGDHEAPWLVKTTPLYKGHSPNVADAVVCEEQKWDADRVNIGREKVVHVADVAQYRPGDPCPAG